MLSTEILLLLGTVFCTVAGYFALQPLMAPGKNPDARVLAIAGSALARKGDYAGAQALMQGGAQLVQTVSLAQVQRYEGGVLARRGEDAVVQGFERALGASEGHDMRAGFRQAQGDGRADAARRAGDQGDTARERFC